MVLSFHGSKFCVITSQEMTFATSITWISLFSAAALQGTVRKCEETGPPGRFACIWATSAMRRKREASRGEYELLQKFKKFKRSERRLHHRITAQPTVIVHQQIFSSTASSRCSVVLGFSSTASSRCFVHVSQYVTTKSCPLLYFSTD